MTEKNNKEPSPCSGCKYEKSTNIKELLAFCAHCKRAYSHEEDRKIHEDRYEAEESEGNMKASERLIENEAEAIECLKSNKPTSGYVMLQESIDMAIQALEKQIPKKPNKTIDSSLGIKKEIHVCPVCDCDLTEVYFIAPQESKIKEKITYCEACGQAIDWSDEE